MPQCKLPNFGILDEIGVPAEILELQNFDEMFHGIIDFLSKDINHSKSEEESLSPEKFKQSIDLKIKKLLVKNNGSTPKSRVDINGQIWQRAQINEKHLPTCYSLSYHTKRKRGQTDALSVYQ